MTAPSATFPREAFLSLAEQRASLNPRVLEKGLLQARSREKHGDLAILMKKIGLIYGYRGTDPELQYLSPYEFIRYWRVSAIDLKKKPSKSTGVVKLFDAEVVPLELAHSWVIRRNAKPLLPEARARYCRAGRPHTPDIFPPKDSGRGMVFQWRAPHRTSWWG
jgi:hypothetical protein